jgi:hypothetical protein
MSEQKNGSRGRRRKRSLSAEEKLQIWRVTTNVEGVSM